MQKPKQETISLVLNCIATVLIVALLALGAYVNVKKPVVGEISTAGFPALNINAAQWNVGCAVIGTAFGMLVTVGLSYDDGILTREEILREEGVIALYMRPLNISRGVDQLRSGWSHATRMVLFLLTLVAALFTTATIAVFGVHNSEQVLFNPSASYPWTTLSRPAWKYFFFPPTSADDDAGIITALDGFLFKSAYIGALKAKGLYQSESERWLPETGVVGDTRYQTLHTEGIGLNTSSYLDYHGRSYRFNSPYSFKFNHLHGDVFGMHIDVKCASAPYTFQKNDLITGTDARFYQINTHKGAHLTILYDNRLTIGSALTNFSGSPLLTIAIPNGIDAPFVSECEYTGNEFVASVSLDSTVSALKVLTEVRTGYSIDDDTKWVLANSMYNFISMQGGGSLSRAWTYANYDFLGDTENSTTDLLESTFSQMGEALISFSRQSIERSNYAYGDEIPNASGVRMSITIAKVGGGSWAWLSVYALLLGGPLLGIVRFWKRCKIFPHDIQDPIKVLEASSVNIAICSSSRIKFTRNIEVVSPDSGILLDREAASVQADDTG